MEEILKKYRYWEWRTIAVLFVGYALFYFVRKNLGMAIPAMEAELGISKTQLGIFLTLHSIIYGFSRFVNGMLVDGEVATLRSAFPYTFSRKQVSGILPIRWIHIYLIGRLHHLTC